MFVSVYHFRVKTDMDEQFRRAWESITCLACEQGGSLGSALIQQDSKRYFAIARWADKKQRDVFFADNRKVRTYQVLMNEAIAERFEPLEGDVAIDLWSE